MTETEKSGKDWNAAITEIKEKPLVACLIGVGFSAALLGGRTQQDEDAFTSNWLIKKTVKEDKIRKEGDRKEKFPILSWLFGKYPNHADSLNSVWSTKLEYARLVAQYYPQDLLEYLKENMPLPIINLTKFLQDKRGSFIHTVNSLLGTELRRMLALRYSHKKIGSLISSVSVKKDNYGI